MAQYLPAGTFCAPSQYPLAKEELKEMALETAQQVVLKDQAGDLIKIPSILDTVGDEFDACFSRMEVLDSMYAYPHYRRNFDRARFAVRHPDLENYITPFCFRFRAKIALSLHPEHVQRVAEELRSANKKSWRPEFLDTKSLVNIKNWFGANIRDDHGKIDWSLISGKVLEIYACDFEYQEQREDYTLESATAEAKEQLDRAIAQKGYWNPSADIDCVNKSLYAFVTSRPQFRRSAKRPDLGKTETDDDQSRPNWFAIAAHLGPKYETTLRIGWWNAEQRYRDFNDAVDELSDTLHVKGYPQWSLVTIYKLNANVYAWFKTHCRTENGDAIDIDKILKACPEEVREKYIGDK
jgi:hypothetical protein